MSTICFTDNIKGFARLAVSAANYMAELYDDHDRIKQLTAGINLSHTLYEANAAAYSARYNDSVRVLDMSLFVQTVADMIINETARPYVDRFQLSFTLSALLYNCDNQLPDKFVLGIEQMRRNIETEPDTARIKAAIDGGAKHGYFWDVDGEDYHYIKPVPEPIKTGALETLRAVKKMTANVKPGDADKAEQSTMRAEYRAIMARRWNGNERMIAYCTNKAARFVRLSSGDLLTIDKPTIETRFCFGYSDSRYDTEDYDRANGMADHARKNQEYFKAENIKQLTEKIDTLNGIGRYGHNVAYLTAQDGAAELNFCRRYELIENKRDEISEADKAAIIKAYQIEAAKFEKRLDTYLKKYGLSKVKSWSYWRDA